MEGRLRALSTTRRVIYANADCSGSTEDAAVVATLVGELLREIMAAVNDKVFTLGHDDTMQCLVPVRG